MSRTFAGIVALAAGVCTFGAVATPATAAPVHEYAHGTARMTSFSTWNACQGYAAWSVKNVAAHGDHLVSGDVARAKCFPTSNGRWTYLTVYTATKPLSAGDFRGSLADYRGDQVWFAEHGQKGSLNSFTSAKCASALSSTERKIISGLNVRLLPGGECMADKAAGQRILGVDYLSHTKTSAYAGDQVTLQDSSLLQEAWMLGYNAS